MCHRWIAEMQSYMPYTIKARSGKKHQNADRMSRARNTVDLKIVDLVSTTVNKMRGYKIQIV